jgi:hypothetical protein
MANRKISDLTALTAPATGDLLPIVDISEAAAADKNKKITYGELLASAPAGSAAAPSFSFDGDPNTGLFNPAADTLAFAEGGVEAMRIDSSGRVLVGMSTARANFFNSSVSPQFQIEGSGDSDRQVAIISSSSTGAFGSVQILAHQKSGTISGNTALANGDSTGLISFQGSDGTKFVEAARITAEVDGTPGTGDMPGRLVFSTTVDGAASPTERIRITSSNFVNIGTQGTDIIWNQTAVKGVTFGAAGVIQAARDADQLMLLNRITNDGILITFAQDGTQEGNISVSGTTVSYNGAHLSRWSQLPGGTKRTEILRGTVLSNIDEMCGWGEEDNEQLNRMKVSDVEGDKNVSGVFQCWDDDDDTYTNDFYCAMTGDFIIRIAEGVMVERGDLLMSAGDGTAKPQDDDIIRSKTVAKVTSTNVSCTYDDGSYCVPCVLMAC